MQYSVIFHFSGLRRKCLQNVLNCINVHKAVRNEVYFVFILHSLLAFTSMTSHYKMSIPQKQLATIRPIENDVIYIHCYQGRKLYCSSFVYDAVTHCLSTLYEETLAIKSIFRIFSTFMNIPGIAHFSSSLLKYFIPASFGNSLLKALVINIHYKPTAQVVNGSLVNFLLPRLFSPFQDGVRL